MAIAWKMPTKRSPLVRLGGAWSVSVWVGGRPGRGRGSKRPIVDAGATLRTNGSVHDHGAFKLFGPCAPPLRGTSPRPTEWGLGPSTGARSRTDVDLHNSRPPPEAGTIGIRSRVCPDGRAMRARYLIAAVASAVAFAFARADQQPIVIQFSHVVAVDTPKGQAAEFFKKRAEELTAGRVRVDVYPNSTLYKDKEEIEALELGSVQMLAPSLSKFGPLGLTEFEVLDLAFIFDDYADLRKVTEGPVGKRQLEKLEPKGIHGLAYWDNGFKDFSANSPF